MQTDDSPTIRCDHCGRQYRWRPELAGRTARCACGHPIPVPAEAAESPEAAPPPEPLTPDDVFAMAAAEAAATESSAAPAAAQVPASARSPAKASAAQSGSDLDHILARRGISRELVRRKRKQEEAAREAARADAEQMSAGNVLRDVVAPVVLIPAGIALLFAQAMVWTNRPEPSVAAAMPVVATHAALAVGLMLGGIWLATAALDVTLLGSFASNILRLSAIALAPAAVQDILRFTLGGPFAGPFMGAVASIACYAVLFRLLMRLDAKDTSVCVTITFILVAFASYAAWRVEGMRRGSDI